MNKALPLLALLAAVAVGCKPSTPSETVSKSTVPKGLPDALQNDAFEYYGLGNDKPMRLEVVEGENGLPKMGNRTIKLQKIEGDKAIYLLTQDGDLAGNQGDITLSLEKDGLYTMSSTTSKMKPHSLEMPARLEVGQGWKDHTEMADGKIDLDFDVKVVGFERVATPGGTFDDALHVTSKGTGTMGEGPIDITTDMWYVRGLGAVKQVLNITPKDAGGAKRTITMQLADPKKPDAPSEAQGAMPPMGMPAPAPGKTP